MTFMMHLAQRVPLWQMTIDQKIKSLLSGPNNITACILGQLLDYQQWYLSLSLLVIYYLSWYQFPGIKPSWRARHAILPCLKARKRHILWFLHWIPCHWVTLTLCRRSWHLSGQRDIKSVNDLYLNLHKISYLQIINSAGAKSQTSYTKSWTMYWHRVWWNQQARVQNLRLK